MIVMSCYVLHAASKNLNKKSKTDLKTEKSMFLTLDMELISHETEFFF